VNQETDLFERALSEFGRYLVKIEPNQWSAATPDTDWDVRRLVAHNLGEVAWVPDLLAGRTIEEVGDKYAGDLIGDNVVNSWDIIAAAATKAVRAGGDLNRTTHLSYGDFPARTYLQHQLIDLTIHAWDLARALGSNDQLDPDLAQAAYEWFAPQAAEWHDSGITGPAVRVAEDADSQIKLIALSGRRPNWSPPSR
jgi:uncharacterized protein (TIGR03086 family)